MGTSGYVYTKTLSASGATQNNQIFIFPSNSLPSGLNFTPLSGAMVKSLNDSSLGAVTDSNGYFSISGLVPLSSDLTPDVIVDPGSKGNVTGYPIFYGTKMASELTDLRIVPPYNNQSTWAMKPGQVEWFNVVGKDALGYWYVVYDSISWSADSSIGSFASSTYGIFQAGQGGTGNVTANFADKTLTLSVTVSSSQGFGTINGTVKDTAQNAVGNAVVEVKGLYTMAMTDKDGNYTIQVPNGTYSVVARDIYNNTSSEASVTVLNNIQKADLTLNSSGTNLTSYVTGIVQTDKMSYSGTDTVKMQLSLINLGSQSISLNSGSIKFELIQKNSFYDAGTTKKSTSQINLGTVTIGAFGSVLVPGTQASMSITETNPSGYYYIRATVYTASTPYITVESPVVIGEGSYFPGPGGGTPVPGQTGDYYRLSEINTKLGYIYNELYSKANRAYNGEDVKSEVNSNSQLRADLLYVRNSMLPYLQTVSYSGWQTRIDYVISDLDQYAYYGGYYNDLYNGASKIDSLVNAIADTQSTLPAAGVAKK